MRSCHIAPQRASHMTVVISGRRPTLVLLWRIGVVTQRDATPARAIISCAGEPSFPTSKTPASSTTGWNFGSIHQAQCLLLLGLFHTVSHTPQPTPSVSP